jgi:predicted metal-dependent peptidase
MSAKVPQEEKSYYAQLIETQWDNIQAPNINLHSLRSFLQKQIPFYAQALQLIDIVFDDTEKAKTWPSFGYTNGYKIYISPKLYEIHSMVVKKSNKPWFASPELGIGFVILHEIGHLVFDSFGRIAHRDPQLWNIATDYQINQFVSRIMKECGVFKSDSSYTKFMEVLNKNFLMDPAKYSKLSAEATYDDLYKHGIRGNHGDGWSLNGDMQGDGSGKDDNGNPLSSEEQMARDIIKSELSNYSQKNGSKLPGQGSGWGRDFEMQLEPPKVNLRQVLKHITDRENTEDYGYSRRGSRMDHMIPRNMRLPSVIESQPDLIRKVMVALDFSGSMSQEQCRDALNIINEVLNKHTRNPVYLIIHTDGINWHGDIGDYKEVPTHYTGGTSFKCIYDLMENLRKEKHIVPSVFIHCTDGYGEFGDDDYTPKLIPFHKKLIWIIQGSDSHPCIGKVFWTDEVGS